MPGPGAIGWQPKASTGGEPKGVAPDALACDRGATGC